MLVQKNIDWLMISRSETDFLCGDDTKPNQILTHLEHAYNSSGHKLLN